MVEIVDYASRNTVEKISFSGGEFFVHPSSYKVLEYSLLKNIPNDNLMFDRSIDESYENVIRLIYKKKILAREKNNACKNFPHVMAIKYDGGVYPCPEAREHGFFYMGNVNEKPLEHIIEEYLASDESAKLFNHALNKINECDGCIANDICNRGCRLRAYKYHGIFLAPDPFCCKIFRNDFSEEQIGKLFWGIKESSIYRRNI